MLLRFLVVLVFLGAQAKLHAATILVWGDSLSAGFGLQSGQAWPDLLQQRLKQQGFAHVVINASVSGETTSGGRSRLPAALERHQPSILILELGANDGLRGLPPALITANLEAMISAAQEAGAKVLLVGMQLPPNYGAAYARRFSQIFPQLATRLQLGLVAFLLEGFASDAELFLDDGLHPTAAAQPLVLENIWQGLEALLQ